MPVPANLQKRDFMTTIIAIATTMCRGVTAFGFVIEAKYADKPAVMALYLAAKNLCELLPEARDEFYEPEGQNEDIEADPGNTPGINPGAPVPPPLPEPE